MSQLGGLLGYGVALREVASRAPSRALEVLGKLLWARAKFGYGPEVFFLFDLHNRKSDTWGSYVPPGNRGVRVLRSVNNKTRRLYSTTDKLATADRLSNANVPCAPIVGVTGRTESKFKLRNDYRRIQDEESLVAFLNSGDCPDALFSKPAWGQKGQGAIGASRSNSGWKVGDENMTADVLAAKILAESDSYGRLLQPELKNHPDIEKITGDVGLSTVRFVTAFTKDGPKVIVATQKLIGLRSLADNFLGGVTGNLIASIDLKSGTLGKCYGRKKGDSYLLTHYDRHPVTGNQVKGAVLPRWDDACSVALAAAETLSDEPFLGFDVALTAEGPVVLEANNAWSWSLPQITAGAGARALFSQVIGTLNVPDSDRDKALEFLGIGID